MRRRPLGATVYAWTVMVCAGGALWMQCYFTWLTITDAKIDMFETPFRYALVMNFASVGQLTENLGFGSLVYKMLNPETLNSALLIGVSMSFNLVGVLSSVGVLLLQQWARFFALLSTSITLVLLVPSHPWEAARQAHEYGIAALMMGLGWWFVQVIFGIWTIWYFLRPAVKAQFVKSSRA